MADDIPAVDVTATPNAEAAPETPATSTATAVAGPEATTAEPSPAPSKPDLASLLQDPDYRKQLFDHPDIRREIDHRASSEAGRRAKAEFERWQQQENARKDREKLLQMDVVELGEQRQKELQGQLEDEALEARLLPKMKEKEVELNYQFGQQVFGAIFELAKESGIPESELEELDPASYRNAGEWVKGAIKFMGTREGKRLAKDLAKAEATAMREAERAAERESSPAPEVLPPAEPGMSDTEYTAAYASGKSNNTARQLKWMRDNGIPV